jgi:hypothetical protein
VALLAGISSLSAITRRLGAGLLVALLLAASACRTNIQPPEGVAEPARIALLDHGRHASLILETPGGGMTRYAYGDWHWYAAGRNRFVDGVAALLWPTQAALGRRQFDGPFAPHTILQQVHVPIEHTIVLNVEARRIDRLVEHLNRIYEDNRAMRLDSRAYDLVFVPHPERYWMLNNSNQMVGRWLEALGCRVGGLALFSDWSSAP